MTVEEMQKDLLFDIASSFMTADVPKEDYQSVQTKVIALIAAVEEQTKEKIRKAGEFVRENASIPSGQFISESLSIGREVLLYADCDLFITPASVLALKEEEL
jgi:hypothetical protein